MDPEEKEKDFLERISILLILVSGVVGGLLIVIAIMLFIKYCVKKRDKNEPPGGIKTLVSRIQPNLRAFKMFRPLGELVSSGTPDETTKDSTDVEKIGGERSTDEIVLSLDNEIDAAVAEYRDKLKGSGEIIIGETNEQDAHSTQQQQQQQQQQQHKKRHESATSESEISRHVSFEMDDADPTAYPNEESIPLQERQQPKTNRKSSNHLHAPPLHHKSASLPSAPQRQRYTQGDYHHLKSSRIDRSPQLLIRPIKQRSLPMPTLMKQSMDLSICEDDISEMTPMLSPVNEDHLYTHHKQTKIKAEIHANPSDLNGGIHSEMAHSRAASVDMKSERDMASRRDSYLQQRDSSGERIPRKLPSLDRVKQPRNSLGVIHGDRQVRSLDITTQRLDHRYANNRRVMSYEEDFVQLRSRSRQPRCLDSLDYDKFKITEFSRLPSSNPHFGTMSDIISSHTGKLKFSYNDIGSFEDINDKMIDGIVEDIEMNNESETETLNGTRKYKEIWNLRSTFEEDEELSDTVRMENHSSPEEFSPEEIEQPTSVTTSSFDSNTEPTVTQSNMSSKAPQNVPAPTQQRRSSTTLLPPKYENRRKSYQSILSRRNQKMDFQCPPRPNDTSFDSFETIDTDGDASESSRQEVTTTSFESSGTTDNTDSTGDSSSHKLQQMRGDSGYKSLETQNSQTQLETSPKSPKSNMLSPNPSFQMPPDSSKQTTKSPSSPRIHAIVSQQGRSSSLPESHKPSRSDPHRSSHYFDRRAAKTASKKRRDFRSPKHNVRIHQSVQEAESDSRSDQPSGDSFEDNQSAARFSIFNKIIRTKSEQQQQTSRAKLPVVRDYSIDERTDAVFNEFMRYDEALDSRTGSKGSPQSSRGSPNRYRMQRKNSEAISGTRRDRYTRGSRSASVDCSSTGLGPFHTISPQDSIEEEDEEALLAIKNTSNVEIHNSPHNHRKNVGMRYGAKGNSNIPLIRLEKESVEA